MIYLYFVLSIVTPIFVFGFICAGVWAAYSLWIEDPIEEEAPKPRRRTNLGG